MANMDYQGLSGLFGQASPYVSVLHGEEQKAQQLKTMQDLLKLKSDLESSKANTEGKTLENSLFRDTYKNKVTKSGLDNLQAEENIIEKRHANSAAQFKNMWTQKLGEDFWAGNEKLNNQVAALGHMQKVTEGFGTVASHMRTVPPLQRPAMLSQYAKTMGLPQEQTEVLLKMSPEELPNVLTDISIAASQSTGEHQRALDIELTKFEHAKELAKLKGKLDIELESIKGGNLDKIRSFEQAVVKFGLMAASLPEGEAKQKAQAQVDYWREQIDALPRSKLDTGIQPRTDPVTGKQTPEWVGKKVPSIGPVPSLRPGVDFKRDGKATRKSSKDMSIEELMNVYGTRTNDKDDE